VKYIKKLFALLLALLSCSAYASFDSGTFINEPSLGGFDFKYGTAMNQPKANLNSEVKLQAEFQWYGSYGAPVPLGHVVLGFTQTNATNAMVSPAGQMLFSHGAGAIVGQNGLNIELWFRDDNNQTGTYNDDDQNAALWNQNNNRCVFDVLGTFPSNYYCLASTPSATGEYITPAPNFQLRKGIRYILRIKMKPSTTYPGRTRIEAQLLEQQLYSKVLIQSAAVDFVTSAFFPKPVDMQATVARAPSDPDASIIYWKLWDNWN
jgi:hypothetical protein